MIQNNHMNMDNHGNIIIRIMRQNETTTELTVVVSDSFLSAMSSCGVVSSVSPVWGNGGTVVPGVS